MNSTASAATIFTKPISPEVEISSDLNGLQPLLQRLDLLITKAISAIQTREKAEVKLGLSWLQTTEISSEQTSIQIRENSLLAWLQKTFNLSTFDLDILTIVLAPELDKQYERVYAYLQDDMSNRIPTVDLVFNLLCSSIPEKLSRRKHFTTNAPLIHHRLLHLSSEATLLSQHLILDSQIIRFLLHQPGLDSRLTSCCQLLEPTASSEFIDNLYLQTDVQNKLELLITEDWQNNSLYCFIFKVAIALVNAVQPKLLPKIWKLVY